MQRQSHSEKTTVKADRAILIIKLFAAVSIILPLLLAWLTGAFSF